MNTDICRKAILSTAEISQQVRGYTLDCSKGLLKDGQHSHKETVLATVLNTGFLLRGTK